MNDKIVECKDGICSFNITGKNFFMQKWYHCITCYLSNPNKGCCEACKNVCHKGHQIEYRGMQYCFCDCGSGDCPIDCKCMQNSQVSSNLLINDEILVGKEISSTTNSSSINNKADKTNTSEFEQNQASNNIESKNFDEFAERERKIEKRTSLYLRSIKNPNQTERHKKKSPQSHAKKRFRLYV